MGSGGFGVVILFLLHYYIKFVDLKFGQIGPYACKLSYDFDLENVFENAKFLSLIGSVYTEPLID